VQCAFVDHERVRCTSMDTEDLWARTTSGRSESRHIWLVLSLCGTHRELFRETAARPLLAFDEPEHPPIDPDPPTA
jgi:hypothetical protein